MTAAFAVKLGLRWSWIIRVWLAGPAIPATAFALGVFVGWKFTSPTSGVPETIASLAVAAVIGSVALVAAIVVARGPEQRTISSRLKLVAKALARS
jgi:hypothetical protein